MLLYLRNDLLKSEGGKSEKSDKPSSKGSQRGGAYVARSQVGYETDGSPKYRYFKTQEEYQSFLASRGKAGGGKKLESKVEKEHKESTEKQHGGDKKPAAHGLLAKDKAEKSLRLYVRT